MIGPRLHHLPPLGQIGSLVVDRRILLRSLCASCVSITSGRQPNSLSMVEVVCLKLCGENSCNPNPQQAIVQGSVR